MQSLYYTLLEAGAFSSSECTKEFAHLVYSLLKRKIESMTNDLQMCELKDYNIVRNSLNSRMWLLLRNLASFLPEPYSIPQDLGDSMTSGHLLEAYFIVQRWHIKETSVAEFKNKWIEFLT